MRLPATLLLAGILAFPAAGGGVDLEATPYLRRAFTEGERIEYSLSWLGIVGGTAVMTIDPMPDRIRITSLARSHGAIGRLYPVRDEIESVVDRKTFSTLRFEKILNERNRHRQALSIFDPVRGIVHRKGEEIPYSPPIFDPLSTVYFLRTVALTPGKRIPIRLIADDQIYEIEAVVHGREQLRIDGSVFNTILVEPKMRHGGIFRDENNRLLIWYTDDSRKVPVRIRSELDFGHITATIRTSRLGGGEGEEEAGGGKRSQ